MEVVAEIGTGRDRRKAERNWRSLSQFETRRIFVATKSQFAAANLVFAAAKVYLVATI